MLGNGNKGHDPGSSFLAKVAIVLGIAATATVISICLKQPVLGSSLGIQFLAEGSSSSVMAAAPVGFTFKAFGYKVLLPEFAPGYAHGLVPYSIKSSSFLLSLPARTVSNFFYLIHWNRLLLYVYLHLDLLVSNNLSLTFILMQTVILG